MKMSIYLVVLLVISGFLIYSCKPKATPLNGVTYSNIEIAALSSTIENNKDLILLDVRTPEETSKGVISDQALKIDYFADDFESKITQLDKDKTYLVYCKSGGRSAKSAQKMINLGFTKVMNLKGGYTAFKKSNP